VEEQSPYPKERGRTEPRPEFSRAVVEQFTSTKENPRRWVTLIFEIGVSEPRGTA
jgi:hypothetical protein